MSDEEFYESSSEDEQVEVKINKTGQPQIPIKKSRKSIAKRAKKLTKEELIVPEPLLPASTPKKEIKLGDFVVIQFGHNDASAIDKEKFRGSLKGNGDETLVVVRDSLNETVHTFGWYMNQFIRDSKEKGAIPIVLSQTPRNEWHNNSVERKGETYCLWSKEAALKEGAFYIDINATIAAKYEELGKEKVNTFFPKDHTHTGSEGATFNALTIAESVKNAINTGLEDYIVLPKK